MYIPIPIGQIDEEEEKLKCVNEQINLMPRDLHENSCRN
jgi:hypothetical protein